MSAEPSSVSRPAIDAVEGIGPGVAARIEALLAHEIDRWSELDKSLLEPLTSLRSLVLAGGKRLRPAFCYWAFLGAGGATDDPKVVNAGAALEMLHSFALIHDDVMDDSRRRRGDDAVHVQFEKAHQARQWQGESRRFGEGIAILVGDMAFVYADLLMSGSPREALDVFTEMRVELNIGQYLDISATASSDASLPMSQKIARYKSGKYTVERPMHLGAALAGRLDDLEDVYSRYGEPVGEAFQLRDDLLGAFGDTELTGKPVGGDLREGKPTALLAIARERAQGEAAKLLEERYGASDLRLEEVTALQEVLIDTGARSDIEQHIDELVATGISALDGVELDDRAHENLVELAYFVAGRHH